MDAEFDDLKREFLAEAGLKVQEIRDAVSAKTAQSLERVGYLAHQLKGSGGSYGFQVISVEAAELEKAVERVGLEDAAGEIATHVRNLTAEIDKRTLELTPDAPV